MAAALKGAEIVDDETVSNAGSPPSDHAKDIMQWAARQKLDEHWRQVAVHLEEYDLEDLAHAVAAAAASFSPED